MYKKTTANPKEIDFAKIGAVVKNKIPEAAVKAFNAKVPKAQATPFDFAFDYDAAARKLQITVKKAGPDFVFGWTDTVFVENTEKMKGAEAEIAGWKEKIEEAIGSAEKLHGGAGEIGKWVESVEKTTADGKPHPDAQKEVEAIDAAVTKLENENVALRAKAGQFWNSGPNGGVAGLLKKHGVSEQVIEERQKADADYKALQATAARFQESSRAVDLAIMSIRKRNKDLGVKLSMATVTMKTDVGAQVDDAALEIQKTVGEIQGYANADFEEVKAKELTKAAKEFAGKSGATWTKLSADPGEIDKAIAQIRDVGLKMRVRSGRVEERYQAWQKPIYQGKKALEKYQGMLKMVRDEYFQSYGALEKTLQGYSESLTKYRPKAVDAAAKAAKAAGKKK